jgi:hypothetical protein
MVQDVERHMESIRRLQEPSSLLFKVLVNASGTTKKLELLYHCLVAHREAAAGMPRVPFDIVFAMRDGLMDGLNIMNQEALDDWQGVDASSGGALAMSGASSEPLSAPSGRVLLSDGQALLDPEQAVHLEQRLKATETPIRIEVDPSAPAHEVTDPQTLSKQQTVLQVARRVQLEQLQDTQESNIQLSLAARHLLHFDAIYAHLAGPNNRLLLAELQGNPKLDMVPLCAHTHLASQHGVKVRFLTALQHRDLAQHPDESPADAESAGEKLVQKALRKLALEPAGPSLFTGLDVAGAETERLDSNRLRGAMNALAKFANSPYCKNKHPLVMRVHAGESYVKGAVLTEKDMERGKQNIAAVLIATAEASDEFRELCNAGKLIQRIGHATHLDTSTQLREVARWEIRLEFNTISNESTGADPHGHHVVLRATVLRNALHKWNSERPNSPVPEDPNAMIRFEISTDSNGVMGGELSDNIQRVMQLLAEPPLLVSSLSPRTQDIARDAGLVPESPGVASASEVTDQTEARVEVGRQVRRGSGSRTLSELSDALPGRTE